MHKVIKLFILLFPLFIFAQTKISGEVYDAYDIIPNANVILKDSVNSIIDYTFSNDAGKYILETNQKGKLFIEFTSLGYNQKNVELFIQDQKDIDLDIVLEEEIIILNDVIVLAKRDIVQRNDTIIFDAKAFAQGNEAVVEDLLRKIPGLNIDPDGTIKVGNQEVEKVMVEGDDFFEKGYKILTKNMPAHPIEKIELLQNYSNNRLLKDVEESNRVALNLKLNEDAKRVWFGNFTLGFDALSDENRYFVKGNLMNFGKNNKFYFLTNLNNTGHDASGDINHLIRPLRFDEPSGIGDDQSISSLIRIRSNTPNLKPSRTTFNNAEMASINAIFNPTEKLKIKTLGFFNWDELDFFYNKVDQVFVNDLNFTNTEDYHSRKSKKTGFGKLDITYDISDNQMLELTSKYENSKFKNSSDLSFNGLPTRENLDHPVELFDQKISYSHKIQDKKVVLLTSRFINELSPQHYTVNQFLFEDLFPNTPADNIQQTISQKMTFAGFEAHLLDRKQGENLLELKLGNAFRKDNFNTQFLLFEDRSRLESQPDYENNLVYSVNNLFAKGKYQFCLNSFKLIGELSIHQLFNTIEQTNLNLNQSPFFVNPSLGIEWDISNKQRIRTSYAQNRTNGEVLNVYDNFVFTGFRNFKRGTGDFNQLDESTFFLNHELGNWTDRFFANTNIIYTKNHDFYSTNSLITQNYTQSNALVIKDRELFIMNTSIDYFIKKLDGNVKFKLGYTVSDFKNIVNDSDLRQVKSINYNYGFEYKTVFDGIFNFHLGSNWITNKIETTTINRFTDNISFLDVTLIFNDKLNFDLSAESYFFGNLKDDNQYYFLDFDAKYIVKENKLTLMLSGQNLLNTDTFRSISISDIGISTSEVRLLPRFVLLKLEYRF